MMLIFTQKTIHFFSHCSFCKNNILKKLLSLNVLPICDSPQIMSKLNLDDQENASKIVPSPYLSFKIRTNVEDTSLKIGQNSSKIEK